MTKKKHLRVYLPTILGGIFLLAVTVLIIDAISNIEEKPDKKERKVQKITLTKPPPPPPPPPKVEKPPEPEVENKIDQAPEPEPEEMPDVADEPPPGDLGLDAEGSAGSDGFGLAARKGGKGLLGGGGNDPYAWYGGIIKNDILDILSEHEELRRKGYTAIIKLWVDIDGSIKRFELAKGSNDSEIDELINQLLNRYKKVNEPLPPGMEQPIKLRITSRI
ncbi:TonB C-terminal domain-containing protein [Methylovulum sp.]|uniref:TonB C-terminal domain-containing protein n=1 Tax=Methylovulum sp. TaxID=1916980 RepID=UPI00263570DA|nr:TonB C-terminal domain-containing protein [Methylovulum sp.]MDD5125006.1 TonB C-terminal domain-containing protein [Methylovulum sp.]